MASGRFPRETSRIILLVSWYAYQVAHTAPAVAPGRVGRRRPGDGAAPVAGRDGESITVAVRGLDGTPDTETPITVYWDAALWARPPRRPYSSYSSVRSTTMV
jgi:hypothetical protein